MCGKNITDSILQCCLWGSPPRVREKLHFFVAFACASRITPACAGKTLGGIHQSLTTRDHPRVCGKNSLKKATILGALGSPPRVREKPLVISLRRYTVGITPACAGKTLERESSRLSWEDHPRVCGKNLEYLLETLTLWGSPPRVREKPVSGFVVVSNVGITPACAGKTHYPSVECCQAEDHPRVCGKNASLERFWTTTWGSPPRVREKLHFKR